MTKVEIAIMIIGPHIELSWSMDLVPYFIIRNRVPQFSTAMNTLPRRMNMLARKVANENLAQCLRFRRNPFHALSQYESPETAM